jgi:hypothetical protein
MLVTRSPDLPAPAPWLEWTRRVTASAHCGVPPWAPPPWTSAVHILLIHQAFAALGEPGGTRHHELARWLVRRGHRVTILAGQVSYLTGEAGAGSPADWIDDAGVHIRRCATYRGIARSSTAC